ncbi:hypothetical protein Hdeb2414_s0014g00424171 [Helianthus debilis subsp. tardiflorus]
MRPTLLVSPKFFGVFFGCAFWRGDVASLCFQLSVMVVRLIFARQPTFPVMIINGDTDDPYSSILILWVHLFKVIFSLY